MGENVFSATVLCVLIVIIQYGLGSYPGWVSTYVSFPKRPYQTWGPPNPFFCGYKGHFSEVERMGREIDHTPPSGAEDENEWSLTPAFFL